MRQPLQRPQGPGGQFLWDLLTFEKMLTSQVFHLVYWTGLGIIGIVAFGIVGASIGIVIRGGGWEILLALPIMGIGLLMVFAGVLLWRSFCEFYVTIFKISENLAVLRAEAERTRQQGR